MTVNSKILKLIIKSFKMLNKKGKLALEIYKEMLQNNNWEIKV